ncbi:MAG: sulfatase-like hydrolase/transferase, partial [Phycisphaerae bacterium]|nr:sulfatase-like hydrolase/transferase [Phycisphaerae bacterium]
AEHLKAGGYRTGLFGKWHLGAHLEYGPTKQGFDEFFGLRGGFIDNYNHYFLHGKGFHDLYEGTKEVFEKDKYFPDLITARALKFIETNKAGPFFMYLAFNIPHYPEQADKKFDERYKDLKMPRQAYAKMISTVDDRIGLVLKKLNDLQIRDNTIIVFMSDNGHSRERNHIRMDNHNSGLAKGTKYGANGGGGNTGKWIGAKGSFQEGGIRVPAIISYPKKLPSGIVRDQAITAADWYPTISELCGLAQPKVKLDGQSLLKIIKSADCPTHHEAMHWQWGSQWAVRQGDWKLIGNGKRGRSLGNLAGDKPERENFIKTKPDIAKRLLELHLEWVKEVTPKK